MVKRKISNLQNSYLKYLLIIVLLSITVRVKTKDNCKITEISSCEIQIEFIFKPVLNEIRSLLVK